MTLSSFLRKQSSSESTWQTQALGDPLLVAIPQAFPLCAVILLSPLILKCLFIPHVLTLALKARKMNGYHRSSVVLRILSSIYVSSLASFTWRLILFFQPQEFVPHVLCRQTGAHAAWAWKRWNSSISRTLFNLQPKFLLSNKYSEKTSPLGGLFRPKGELASKNVIYKSRIS